MPHETEQPAKGGQLLRAFRLREGLSQEHLAQRAAVSPRTIRQIESGRSRPRPSTLKVLGEALKLSEGEWASLLEMSLPDEPGDEDPEPYAADQPAMVDVPRQLPSAPGNFVGRAMEMAEMDGAVNKSPLWTITGPGGIGKTWLALRWAHDNVDNYPDGQLYINLRGFDPDAEAVAPAEALQQLLYALNASPAAIPGDIDSRSALYRSILARRRMLVVLDNARDERQVASLLPGDSSCTTLITSRNDLVGLTTTHGAKHVGLGLFDDTEALDAVARTIGDDRVNAEPEAATALVQLCGGLPLAIGILAARAATHPRFPLSAMVEELREEANQLDAFDIAGLSPNLRSVFAASLRQLSPRAVRAFRLLGQVPTAGISGYAVASLLGETLPRTRCTLRELETANLLEQHVPGRYRLQDLIRLYATEQSYHALTPAERSAALRRLIDHYVHTAEAADRHLSPWRTRQDLETPAPGSLSTPIGDSAAGLRWFESETANILSAQRIAVGQAWHDKVWQLAWLSKLAQHWFNSHETEIQLWAPACQAAEHLDQIVARFQCNLFMGQSLAQLGRGDEAMSYLERALDYAAEDDNPSHQAAGHFVVSATLQAQDKLQQALSHAITASRFASRDGVPTKLRGETLNMLGWTRALTGDFDRGRADCQQAIELLRGTEHNSSLADTWDSLGYICHQQGHYTAARERYEKALALYQAGDGGHPVTTAVVYQRLGDVHEALDEPVRAVRTWRLALSRLRSLNRTEDTKALTAKIATVEQHMNA